MKNLQSTSLMDNHGRYCFFSVSLLLYQDVTYGFYVLVAIIWTPGSSVSTGIGIIFGSSASTKSDSWIGVSACIPHLIGYDANPCFGRSYAIILNVEPFHLTKFLQRGISSNQRFPCVTTKWGVTVFPISNQWIQGTSLLVDDNKPFVLSNLHPEADFVKGCFPVGW